MSTGAGQGFQGQGYQGNMMSPYAFQPPPQGMYGQGNMYPQQGPTDPRCNPGNRPEIDPQHPALTPSSRTLGMYPQQGSYMGPGNMYPQGNAVVPQQPPAPQPAKRTNNALLIMDPETKEVTLPPRHANPLGPRSLAHGASPRNPPWRPLSCPKRRRSAKPRLPRRRQKKTNTHGMDAASESPAGVPAPLTPTMTGKAKGRKRQRRHGGKRQSRFGRCTSRR